MTRKLTRDLWRHLRTGDLSGAFALCADRGQSWRAASLQGMLPEQRAGSSSSTKLSTATYTTRRPRLHESLPKSLARAGNGDELRAKHGDWSECFDILDGVEGNKMRVLWKLSQFEISRRLVAGGAGAEASVETTSAVGAGLGGSGGRGTSSLVGGPSGAFEAAIAGYCGGVAPCLHRLSFTWWDHIWSELHCIKEHFVERWLALQVDPFDPVRKRLSGPFAAVAEEDLDDAVYTEVANMLLQFENHEIFEIRTLAREPFARVQAHLILTAWSARMIAPTLDVLADWGNRGFRATSLEMGNIQQDDVPFVAKKFASNLACFFKEHVVLASSGGSGGARSAGLLSPPDEEMLAIEGGSAPTATSPVTRADAGDRKLAEQLLAEEDEQPQFYSEYAADLLVTDYITELAKQDISHNLDEIVERLAMLSAPALDEKSVWLLDYCKPPVIETGEDMEEKMKQFPLVAHRLVKALLDRFTGRALLVLTRAVQECLRKAWSSTSHDLNPTKLFALWDGAPADDTQYEETHDCEFLLSVLTIVWGMLGVDDSLVLPPPDAGASSEVDAQALEEARAIEIEDRLRFMQELLEGLCHVVGPEALEAFSPVKHQHGHADGQDTGDHERERDSTQMPMGAMAEEQVDDVEAVPHAFIGTPVVKEKLPPAHPLSPTRPSWSLAKAQDQAARAGVGALNQKESSKGTTRTKRFSASNNVYKVVASSKSKIAGGSAPASGQKPGASPSAADQDAPPLSLTECFLGLRSFLLNEAVLPLVVDLLATYALKNPFRAAAFVAVVEQDPFWEMLLREDENYRDEHVEAPAASSTSTTTAKRTSLKRVLSFLNFYRDYDDTVRNKELLRECIRESSRGGEAATALAEQKESLTNAAAEFLMLGDASCSTAATSGKPGLPLQPKHARPQMIAPLRDFLLGDVTIGKFLHQQSQTRQNNYEPDAGAATTNQSQSLSTVLPTESWSIFYQVSGIRCVSGLLSFYRQINAETRAPVENLVSRSPWFLPVLGEEHARRFLTEYRK
eukprot:GSA25T00003802001.1